MREVLNLSSMNLNKLTLFILLLWWKTTSLCSCSHTKSTVDENGIAPINRYFDECIDSSFKHGSSVFIFRTRNSCIPCFKKGAIVLDSFFRTMEHENLVIYDISSSKLGEFELEGLKRIETFCSVDDYPIRFSDFNFFYINPNDSLIMRTYGLKDIGELSKDLSTLFD